MSSELVFTSASRGLNPNTSGFCTVAATAGLSRQVQGKLEGLSSYEFRFNLSDPNARLNPVNFAHTRMTVGSETVSVLSRIAFCGADYSSRTNKIAHHFLLEPGEKLQAGPAWMLGQMEGKVFRPEWTGDPRDLPRQRLDTLLPRGGPPAACADGSPAACADGSPAGMGGPASPAARQWERVTGDAGWAGVLAKAFRDNPTVPAFVVFNPGTDLLPLFAEALAVLPPAERWHVGFATYYSVLPAGCQYHWRGVLAGSNAEKEIRRFPGATVINLTGPLPAAETNAFSDAARAGRTVGPLSPAKPKGGPAGAPGAPAAGGGETVARVVSTVAAAAGESHPAHAVSVSPTYPPRAKGGKGTLVGLVAALVLLLVVNAATLWQFYQTRQKLRQAQSQDTGLSDRVAAAFASAANLLAEEAESHGRRAEDEAVLAEQAYGAAERAARDKQADKVRAAAQDAANAADRARREAAEAKRIKDALDESGDLAGPAGTGGPPGEAVGRASQAAKAAQEAYQAAQQSAARAASAVSEPAAATVATLAGRVQQWAAKAEKEAALAEAAQRKADMALKKARDAEDEARKSKDPAAKKACAVKAQEARDAAQSALVEAKASTDSAVEALAQADREARANPQDPAVSTAIEKARRAKDRADTALLAAQTEAQQVATIAERLAAAKPPPTPTAGAPAATPAGRAELKMPRDRKDKDLADACSVPVRAPDRSGDVAMYFVGAADGFVRCEPGDLVGKEDKGKLPEALQRIRYYFEAGKRDKLVVHIPSGGGIGLVGKPLVTCQLKEEAGGRVLECRFEPDFHKPENADYRWLVIEVADGPSKIIYQCLMPGRPAEVKHAVVFGYDKRVVLEPKKEKEKGKGKPEMEKREWLEAMPLTGPPLILEYPWPQILTLRLPDGKTPSLAPGARIALEWQVEKWIYLALEHKSEGGAVQVKPTLSSQGLLDKAASEARPALVQRSRELATAHESQRNAQNQLRGAETHLDKAAEKDKPAIRVQIDDLRTRITSRETEIDGHQKAVDALVQPVKDWMDTLNKVLNAKENATLTVRDLWGVPVASLTLKFQPCDPVELIRSKTPPETTPAGK